MDYTKLGFMTLLFLIGTTILVQAPTVDVASAACAGCAIGDYGRCGGCAVRDNDNCDTGGCGDCGRCATITHFRCDSYQCSWVPDFGSCMRCYGCSGCGPR
jgi:hypothetical protein